MPLAGLVILAGLVFLAGVLAGYRASWMDHYKRGRRDSARRLTTEVSFRPQTELGKTTDQLNREWQQLRRDLFG